MIRWQLIPNTPNYRSDCGKYVAIYRRTVRGHGDYWVFPSDWPKRLLMRDALSVGGLPQTIGQMVTAK